MPQKAGQIDPKSFSSEAESWKRQTFGLFCLSFGVWRICLYIITLRHSTWMTQLYTHPPTFLCFKLWIVWL